MSTMQAITTLPGSGSPSTTLTLTTLPPPVPGPSDLLISLRSCALNPIDTKVRTGAFPSHAITGFDGAGTITQLGSSVQNFSVGEEVFFCAALGRQGTNAQFVCVDYRVVARKPRNLKWEEASCVPLVFGTAWEMLEGRFGLVPVVGGGEDGKGGEQRGRESILIINGAGGVGSAATQLARRVFGFGKVIVTASRRETEEWVRQMGATDVISHREDLKKELREKVGVEKVEYIMICHSTNAYMATAVEIAAAKGRIGSIVELGEGEELEGMGSMEAFMKQLSFHWEVILAKEEGGEELAAQGEVLGRVATLYEEGVLGSLMTESEVLSVESLVRGHEKIESGKAIGKIGFTIGDSIQ